MDYDKVYYITDSPKGSGWVFLSELDELENLDLSSSSFLAIVSKSNQPGNKYPEELKIRIYYDGEERLETLQKKDNKIYWTCIEGYTFIFECAPFLGFYKGKKMDGVPMTAVTPVNVDTFDDACKKKRLFFMGDVL